GSRLNAEYLGMDDFEKIPARLNVASKSLNFQGKFDFAVAKNTTVTVGGFVNLSSRRGGRDQTTYNFSLFNWQNNALTENFTWNLWGRVTQRFDNPKDTARRGGLRNALISLQVDYLSGFGKSQDVTHRDRFFDYGYVGRFTTHRAPTYVYG